MFSRLATFFVVLASALYANAAITILAPGTDYWWVSNEQNLFSWTCGSQYNEGYTNFTVLINNSNPSTFNGPQALISIQWDYQCSVLVPPTATAGIPAATGYTLIFADVFNSTHVLATSQPFEIKAYGSAYAPQPSGVASATVTASSANNTAVAGNTSATQSATKSGAAAFVPAGLMGYLTGAVALIGAALAL